MTLCGDCKFYNVEPKHDSHKCGRWKYGYHHDGHESDDDIIVEDDEGWGVDMGTKFGCVLGEDK